MRRTGSDTATEEGGLSGGRLLGTGYAALQAARAGAGYEPADWDDLDPQVQHAVLSSVNTICAGLGADGDDEVVVSVGTLASEAARAFNTQCGGDGEYTPDAKTRVVFEALVRHVANALDFDPSEDGEITSHEEGWKDWVAARI